MAGFGLSRTHSQGDVTGKQFTYNIPASDAVRYSPGDVVVITGDADPDGVPQVAAAAASTGGVTGVIFSVDPTFEGEALSNTGRTPSVNSFVKVNVDPFALYEVDVANGPLVTANVGLNAPIVPDPATLSGGLTVSNMTLNATGVATTNTLPFRIVQLLEDDNQVLGNRALVRVNNSTLNTGTTGI